MKPFYEPLAELERITRGKPGKIPQGKPKVTDGTLAGVRRETPKQVIQQLPVGRAVIKDNPDMQGQITAVLSDIIIPNANSGGTSYAKAKNAIKDTISNGASFAYCFFNRRGSIFHADYKRVYCKDILYEKGKVSEFDTNFMFMLGWYTESDIKAIIWQQEQLKKKSDERKEKYDGQWNLKHLQELLDHGPSEKDQSAMSEEEKKMASQNSGGGFFKIAHAFQIGEGATFYSYSPVIDKVLKKCVTKDPRGIIPIHALVPEEDYANPLGEPLASISAGKQNLLDFDMQMYQYTQGMGVSPAVKKWGQTPTHKIKLVPDAVIEMQGNKQTDDFEVVNISNQAVSNYAANASYIKTQIYNEIGGSNDSSISAEAGAVGFSKTDSGVKQQETRTNISKNDMRKSYELWQGRIWETCLNIHFAESQGQKELELEPDTAKRLKLEQNPVMDYDQDYGTIRFTIDASSSQADDNDKESEKLVSLLEIKTNYGAEPDEKFMRMYNQIVKNAGVDDPEDLMYTDEEIEHAKEVQAIIQKQQMEQLLNPTPPPAPEMPVDPNMIPPEQMPMELPPPPDPIEEDRALAMQALLERGIAPEVAEQLLVAVDGGQL